MKPPLQQSTRQVLKTTSTTQGGGGGFKIGNLWERLVVVNHGWQGKPTDGLKGSWSVGLYICLSVYLFIYLSSCLSISVSIYLAV